MLNNITIWLDETAQEYPDKVGYADENTAWTFQEIRHRALVMADRMIAAGLEKSPVAVYMEKSVDVLAAMFGAAYSGNFYTPLDVSMPVGRIEKILDILQPELMVTKTELREAVAGFLSEDIPVICADEAYEEINDDPEREERVLAWREQCVDTDLLYVLFTSGSTGTPKGVTICHRSGVPGATPVNESLRTILTACCGSFPFRRKMCLATRLPSILTTRSRIFIQRCGSEPEWRLFRKGCSPGRSNCWIILKKNKSTLFSGCQRR